MAFLKRFIFVFSLFLSITGAPYAFSKSIETKSDCGTVIITYRTDNQGTLLDRIRFWMVDENGERRLFPKKDQYVESPHQKTRMVLIEDVPEGDYTLEFLIPNKERKFFPVPARTLSVMNGGVIRIDQAIHKAPTEDIAVITQSDIYYNRPESEIILKKTGERIYSYPSTQTHYPRAYLVIKSSQPFARWTLYQEEQAVATGEGSLSHIEILPGLDYHVEGEVLDGYELKTYPSGAIHLREDESRTIELLYKRTYGNLAIETNLPTGETLEFTIDGPHQGSPIRAEATSTNNSLSWKSAPLPTGEYILKIKAPDYYEAINTIYINVDKGEEVIIRPAFVAQRSIHVTSNNSHARYELRSQKTGKKWKGGGVEHTFDQLIPGTYVLHFDSDDAKRTATQKSKQIILSKYKTENPEIYANYTAAGKLHIESNVQKFNVKIVSRDKPETTYSEQIDNYRKTIPLSEGRYIVSFLPLKHISTTELPKPIDADVRPSEETKIYAHYPEPSLKQSENLVEKTRYLQENIEIPTDPKKLLLNVSAGETIVGDPFKGKKLTYCLLIKNMWRHFK